MHTRPVWVELSRHKLTANYLELRRVMREHHLAAGRISAEAEPAILAVVKANAYGHCMVECAQLLHQTGAEWLGVTSVEEAVGARTACPDANILVMSGIWRGEANAIIEQRLTPIVWEGFHLDLLEAEARRHGLPPQSIRVHLELDTGMSRQGVRLSGTALKKILMRFHAASALRLDGVATHFTAPEVLDSDDTDRQRSHFEAALAIVASHGFRPKWIHAGNSATLLRGGQLPHLLEAAGRLGASFMLRPGLSLYGYAPRFSAPGQPVAFGKHASAELSPVLTWKTRVASLRDLNPGDSVGYNSTFRAARPTRLALLPLGYADGLNRLLSNRGSVLLRGRRAPIAGRISMDQTILDVTDIPGVEIGDEAVILGSQGIESITAYELADMSGTIPYEVLCNIAARVPRLLVD